MTNQKSGSGGSTAVHNGNCVPCSVPAFCRSNYYTGKLLTERDFSDEQRYHADKLRLHYMALHGWGLVCGLTVHHHPHCPQLRIVVEAGLGIDDCGREVRLLRDIELELPRPPAPHPKQPCPPDPTEATPGEAPEADPYGKGEYGNKPDEPEGIDLYVCVRYCETQVEFTPAPFDDCGCNANGQQPNRICESYDFKIFEGEPDFIKHVHEHKHCCDEENCKEIYKRILKECHKPGCVPWLPLAVIKGFVAGKPVTEEMIDNWTVRPLLPSTRMLDHLIQCILDRLPPCPLTHIIDFNWGHGEVYTCRQFINTFAAPGGFEVDFDAEVVPGGVGPDIFEATIVFLPNSPDEPCRTEIARAHVALNAAGKRMTLQIDPGYSHKHLDGHNFNVFLRLRCDVVVDKRGYAVDGNLLGRLDEDGNYLVNSPTGDGIPGGLFESWVQVRMGASKRL